MFGQATQSTWFFDSAVHLEAVCRLLYLVDSHEPFGVVYGPDGSGRTRVLSKLREELQRSGTVVLSLNLGGMDDESRSGEKPPTMEAETRDTTDSEHTTTEGSGKIPDESH